MHEDKRLKCCLVLQSFCPLFILMLIKHGDFVYIKLVAQFFCSLVYGDFNVICRAFNNPVIGNVIISLICIGWIAFTALIAIGFNDIQSTNFDSPGEEISNVTEKKDSGVTFLVTFIVPLLVEDVSTIRGSIFYLVLLVMVIFLLIKSDLVYQNPILALFNYKVFEFQLASQSKDIQNKTYIGLSKGSIPSKNIKWRYIADNVFLVADD